MSLPTAWMVEGAAVGGHGVGDALLLVGPGDLLAQLDLQGRRRERKVVDGHRGPAPRGASNAGGRSSGARRGAAAISPGAAATGSEDRRCEHGERDKCAAHER